VRRRGYAIEDEEATVGDAGIAAPIVNREGSVAGSVGVVEPADRRLDPRTRDDLTRAVLEAARSVSKDPRSRPRRCGAAGTELRLS
jgi:DNA-binding IclR family transcriptional regulator